MILPWVQYSQQNGLPLLAVDGVVWRTPDIPENNDQFSLIALSSPVSSLLNGIK